MASGKSIKVNTGRMKTVASTIENQASIISNCFDSIRKDAQDLSGVHWDGASSESYSEKIEKMCGGQQSSGNISAEFIVNTLKVYVDNINSAAAEYIATDKKSEARSEALPVNIFDI